MQAIRALWGFRGFIFTSVAREFQAKYRNSLFGVVWMILNPLAMITVYTLIFSRIMQSRLPGVEGAFSYSIYLCAGILTWGLFSEITSRSVNIFIENANLIKKLNFPKLCLPVIVVLSALLNFAIIMGLFLAFLTATGNLPGWGLLLFFPVLAVQIVFAVGLGMTLAVFNVFFRDVGQMFGILLNFWFWFTPIVYPASVLPPEAAQLLAFNPMVHIIGAYQSIFVTGHFDDWNGLLPVAVVGLILCALGLSLLRRNTADMVDEL